VGRVSGRSWQAVVEEWRLGMVGGRKPGSGSKMDWPIGTRLERRRVQPRHVRKREESSEGPGLPDGEGGEWRGRGGRGGTEVDGGGGGGG